MPYFFVWAVINFAVGFAFSGSRNGSVLSDPKRGYVAMLLLNAMALAIMGDYFIFLSTHHV